MSPTKSGQKLQFTIRLDPADADRVKALEEKLGRPGMPATMTDVLRAAVAEGLPVLEKAAGIKPKK
ncbi:MAG TPA: hypothetical protein VGK67_35335 [Myxococcales bacterium]|jgi:hypothetical protein